MQINQTTKAPNNQRTNSSFLKILIFKIRSHTPPLPLFSRVYIRTKKIPYLYIYIMYVSLPQGGHYVNFEY